MGLMEHELLVEAPVARWALPLSDDFMPDGTEVRYKGAWGGRGSGKSHEFASMVVEAMIEDVNCSVVCIREIQKTLKLSAKRLIETKIREFGVSHLFDITNTEIRRKDGTGICIFVGMQDHTADSVKSLEDFDIAWVEEAQSLSKRSLELLRPTIRKAGSQLWFTWNPRRSGDPVEKLLRGKNKRKNAIIVRVNYTDNPFLPDTLRKEAEDDYEFNPDNFAHIWLGAYENLGSKVVIPPMWIKSAVGLAEKLGITPTGKRIGALDVAGADEGGDENSFAARYGILLEDITTWNGLDTTLTTQYSANLARFYGILDVNYDSVSVGEGVTGAWADMGRRKEQPPKMKFIAWNGGFGVVDPEDHVDPRNPNSPLNKDQYHNLKAQGWFHLRKRFENAHRAALGKPYDPDMLISLPVDAPWLSQLEEELSQPQHKPSQTGKTMVDKQPDNSDSPNMGDSVMMAFFPLNADAFSWKGAL